MAGMEGRWKTGTISKPPRIDVEAAITLVKDYCFRIEAPAIYETGVRGIGRVLTGVERALVRGVGKLWRELADFVEANLVNGAEADSREPTLTLDSLYMTSKIHVFVAKGSYIPVGDISSQL
jgi:hypothetical protein